MWNKFNKNTKWLCEREKCKTPTRIPRSFSPLCCCCCLYHWHSIVFFFVEWITTPSTNRCFLSSSILSFHIFLRFWLRVLSSVCCAMNGNVSMIVCSFYLLRLFSSLTPFSTWECVSELLRRAFCTRSWNWFLIRDFNNFNDCKVIFKLLWFKINVLPLSLKLLKDLFQEKSPTPPKAISPSLYTNLRSRRSPSRTYLRVRKKFLSLVKNQYKIANKQSKEFENFSFAQDGLFGI